MDGDNLDVYRVTPLRLQLSEEISLPLRSKLSGGSASAGSALDLLPTSFFDCLSAHLS